MPKMKFYDEEPMREIRKILEKEILGWPGVTSRVMMGVLCYFYGRKFFAFLMPKNIVITKLPENERRELSTRRYHILRSVRETDTKQDLD